MVSQSADFSPGSITFDPEFCLCVCKEADNGTNIWAPATVTADENDLPVSLIDAAHACVSWTFGSVN